MKYDAFELAPGEVTTDRYEPADDASTQPQPVSAAQVAEWEAHPYF